MRKIMRATKVNEDDVHGDQFEHPAFGTVSVSRVSGQAVLFQSAIRHQHYITLTVNRASNTRHLNRDWVMGRDTIVQVAMSEAQWATMVSSLNMGSGTPCTLQYAPPKGTDIETVPGLEVEPTKSTFEAEMSEHLEDMVEQSMAIIERLDGILSGKSVKKSDVANLRDAVKHLRMCVLNNTPFVQKQFASAMEKTVEAGKAEIDGFILRRMQGLGLEALIEQARAEGPLMIENEEDGS